MLQPYLLATSVLPRKLTIERMASWKPFHSAPSTDAVNRREPWGEFEKCGRSSYKPIPTSSGVEDRRGRPGVILSREKKGRRERRVERSVQLKRLELRARGTCQSSEESMR